ncbi:MAG: hypothetical protein GX878_00715 [Firmicutes bacterium]|nr:hypothetical protein [Bacillota bacterium]
MLKGILKIINRDGYISRSRLAKELGVVQDVVDDGMAQLLRMGYLVEEERGADCATSCANCPFARNCSKEIVKVFKISDKGSAYLE